MTKAYPLERSITYHSMWWLLLSQLAVMLPFAFYLPVWLIPVMLFSSIWRLRVIRGLAWQPSNAIKLGAIVLGIAGLWLSGLQPPALDAMVALLLLGFAFKNLELKQKRDALVVVFLGYFLIAVQFLYSQELLSALYGIICMILLTATLISIQRHNAQPMSTLHAIQHELRLAALMLLQCLPLMLLTFLFAPRLPPLWQLPTLNPQHKIGISDQMTPGDVAELGKSNELAFRVEFQGQAPIQAQLYWRGLVLNYFDGKNWRQFEQNYADTELNQIIQSDYSWQATDLVLQGKPTYYEAIYEASGQPWLFTLDTLVQTDGATLRAADYRVMAQQALQAPMLIRATSYLQALRDVHLNPTLRALALQLPATSDNLRTRAFAKQLHQQSGSDTAYIDAVLRYFHQQPYYYTLNPPVLGDSDTIDNFLFTSLRGFCAHYAGSFVYLMRAVGIPARMVVGYQGGEWNPNGHYLSVHQYDAHAWVEVWLEGKGWTRIDPTSAVAPSRIEQGLQAAVAYEGSFLANSPIARLDYAWLKQLRLSIDELQYGWRRWVLGYDNGTQYELLQRLLGSLTPLRLLFLLLVCFALLGLFWAWTLGLHQYYRREPAVQRLYRRFCTRLAKRGLPRLPAQTASAYATLAAERFPDKAEKILAFTAQYETVCYALDHEAQQAPHLKQMRELLRGI